MNGILTPDEIALGRQIFSARMLEGLSGVIATGGIDRWYTITAEQAVAEIIELCGPACEDAITAVVARRETGMMEMES